MAITVAIKGAWEATSVASVVRRKRRDGTVGYKVQWHAGGTRDGTWQSETFDDRGGRAEVPGAGRGERSPMAGGWVKGRSFRFAVEPEPEPVEEHPLLEFGTAYVRWLTNAGPDTRTRYLSHLRSIVGWLRELKPLRGLLPAGIG